MSSYIDFNGQEIKLGDTVVYPVRRKSELILKKAVVCAAHEEDLYRILKGLCCLNSRGRRIVIQNPRRCVVIKRLEK